MRYEVTFLHHLCVDHDHKSGKVRGLLCNAWNTAIGLFEEDLGRFDAAAAYLRHYAVLADGVVALKRQLESDRATAASRGSA